MIKIYVRFSIHICKEGNNKISSFSKVTDVPQMSFFEICQTGRAIFSLLLTTDKNQKCQTPGQENFSLTYYYNLNRAKWPEAEPGNKKSSKSFSRLTAFAGRRWAVDIQF